MPEQMKLPTTYSTWLKKEGLPVITGYAVEDLKTVPLKPWARQGGLGTYIALQGAEESVGCYVCEIPPGANLNPEKHLYEEQVFILSGRGATTIWNEGGKKHTFEWQAGALFAPPINTHHQLFNGQGDKPARFVAVTNAPHIMNLFHSLDFIFNVNWVFSDRYSAEQAYFSGKGKSYLQGNRKIWDSNFVPDVAAIEVPEFAERGVGGKSIFLEYSDNVSAAHISEFPVGTYKKAHRHGPGAHVIIIGGNGYSLLWPEGSPRQRIDWHAGTLLVPPERWFHQHFNTGKVPARYMALRGNSRKYEGVFKTWEFDKDVKAGGDQIEYEDEDPAIRKEYIAELARSGLEFKMPARKK